MNKAVETNVPSLANDNSENAGKARLLTLTCHVSMMPESAGLVGRRRSGSGWIGSPEEAWWTPGGVSWLLCCKGGKALLKM